MSNAHTIEATTTKQFVFGREDGTIVHRASNIDTASAYAVDNLTIGCGIAVFTPEGGSLPAGHFLMLARRMIQLRGRRA